jgi:dihydrofolate reductase
VTSLSLIVAMDRNRLIGRDGDLPWRLPNDLKHFKQLTVGKTVLMGRKTWVSLGRPLPDRENWVLTRDAQFSAPGARVFTGLDAALAAHAGGELMVIGGAQLYEQTLALADRIHLTRVDAVVPGDTYFPEIDASQWREVARQSFGADERHAYAYEFVDLERIP